MLPVAPALTEQFAPGGDVPLAAVRLPHCSVAPEVVLFAKEGACGTSSMAEQVSRICQRSASPSSQPSTRILHDAPATHVFT